MNHQCSGRQPSRVQKLVTHELPRRSMQCAQKNQFGTPPPDAEKKNEPGIVTDWDDIENLASHIVPFDCLQAQDARYGPEGQLTSASLVRKPAESTTLQGFPRQCRVVRWHGRAPMER